MLFQTATPSILVITDTWKKYLNIDCPLKLLDTASEQAAVKAGKFEVAFTDLGGSMADPDGMATYFTTGSANNYFGFSNPTLDALWANQAAEFDMTKRVAITQQIETIVLSEHIIVPFARIYVRRAWWPYVKGYVPNNVSIGLRLDQVWLNK